MLALPDTMTREALRDLEAHQRDRGTEPVSFRGVEGYVTHISLAERVDRPAIDWAITLHGEGRPRVFEGTLEGHLFPKKLPRTRFERDDPL